MQHSQGKHDAIVVGAGPAGLTAAIYLGRFRRRCLVVADGHSRARWIPTSHNIPGFLSGVGGDEFLYSLREQALRYGAEIRHGHVTGVAIQDGTFTLSLGEETLSSPYVLLATGIRDHLPDLPGAVEAVQRSVLRICPICDAYEAIDQRIAVLSDGAVGAREASFLSSYSDRVTVLQIGAAAPTSTATARGSDRIERLSIRLQDLQIQDDRVILRSAQSHREFDVVYLALGCSAQHDLAQSLGAACDEQGALRVTAHQETSVSGLYAAGDVVRGLNQVVVAAAESAIAATDIHNKLRGMRRSTP